MVSGPKTNRWLAPLVALLFLQLSSIVPPGVPSAAASALGQRFNQASDPHGVVVSGEGEIRAEPDIAIVTVGVTHTAPNSQEAMDEVSRRLSLVIAAVRALGLENRDIQTAGLSLSPVYRPRPRNDEIPEIEAYRASNNVSLTVRDLRRTSTVLDAALANGANSMGSLRFSFANPEQLRLQALAAAIANAEAKAQTMAAAAGVGLTGVYAIQEESVSMPALQADAGFARAVQPMAVAPAPPVEGGEMIIRARVRVYFGL
jgi:uncharacterized protein